MTDDWPGPPLITGNWKTLSMGDACALLARVSAAQVAQGGEASAWSVEFSRVRAVPLCFARRWLLVEAEARLNTGDRGLFTLFYGPGRRLVPASWIPSLLRNPTWQQEWPQDATAQAREYLSLFVNYTLGDEGRFALIDSLDRLHSCLAEGASLDAELRGKFAPMSVVPEGSAYKSTAMVVYAGKLFLATFQVDRTGGVTMTGETPLGEVAMRTEVLRGPFRVFPQKSGVAEAGKDTSVTRPETSHESSHE